MPRLIGLEVARQVVDLTNVVIGTTFGVDHYVEEGTYRLHAPSVTRAGTARTRGQSGRQSVGLGCQR
jgi:hypothetical protein